MNTNNKPAHVIRSGPVKATIWKVEHENGPFFSVAITRIYKAEGSWKQSNSFGGRELGTVAAVACLARAWIEEQGAKQ